MKRAKIFESQGTKGSGLSRRGRKAIATTTTPRLRTISDDDRRALLSSRVSNILEEHTDDFNLYLTQGGKRSFDNIPRRLDQYREKDCPLWRKASTVYDHEEDEPQYEQQYEKELPMKQEEGNDKKDSSLWMASTTFDHEAYEAFEKELAWKQEKDETVKKGEDNKKFEGSIATNCRSVSIGIQTDDVIVIAKKSFEDIGVQTEAEPLTFLAMENAEDDILMDVRQEERSFEYREKSFNYDYSEDLNKCIDKSASIFEDSFNDKVFANKLVEKNSKRHRMDSNEYSPRIRVRSKSQTEPSMAMEMEIDDILMDERQEERSLEYIDKPFNEYNEDINKGFDQAATFEDSFNDKVFANKLVETSSKRLRMENILDDYNPRNSGSRNKSKKKVKTREVAGNKNTTTPPNVSASQGGAQCPNHTPMLNYSLIDTPILKKELKRYGLKPFPRSKAKILLRHIYTETHK